MIALVKDAWTLQHARLKYVPPIEILKGAVESA